MRPPGHVLTGTAVLLTLTAATAQQSQPVRQPADVPVAAEQRAGINFVAGPTGGAAVAISRFFSLPETPGIPRPDPASLTAKEALPVYTLEAEAMAAGASMAQATTEDAFYYALVDGDGKPAAGVVVAIRNGNLRATSVNVAGPYLDAIAPAVDRVRAVDSLRSGSYEVRLLSLPGSFGSGMAQVLWLKSAAPDNDLIFVLPQRFIPEGIEADRLYAAADFFELAKPKAQRQIELYRGLTPR